MKARTKKYVVVKENDPLPEPEAVWAQQMQEQFGLYMFSLREIYEKWANHSGLVAAAWLLPTKNEVEAVFNVQLREKFEVRR